MRNELINVLKRDKLTSLNKCVLFSNYATNSEPLEFSEWSIKSRRETFLGRLNARAYRSDRIRKIEQE